MPEIEIEASRTVWYSINKEVTQQQADAFKEVYQAGDKQAIQEYLESWIDPKYDVVDAEEFETLNALLNGEAI